MQPTILALRTYQTGWSLVSTESVMSQETPQSMQTGMVINP